MGVHGIGEVTARELHDRQGEYDAHTYLIYLYLYIHIDTFTPIHIYIYIYIFTELMGVHGRRSYSEGTLRQAG